MVNGLSRVSRGQTGGGIRGDLKRKTQHRVYDYESRYSLPLSLCSTWQHPSDWAQQKPEI